MARHEGSDVLGGFSAGGPLLAATSAPWLRLVVATLFIGTPVGSAGYRWVSQVARQQKVIFEIAKKYRGLRAGPENGSRG